MKRRPDPPLTTYDPDQRPAIVLLHRHKLSMAEWGERVGRYLVEKAEQDRQRQQTQQQNTTPTGLAPAGS